jgi:hypothetical protein
MPRPRAFVDVAANAYGPRWADLDQYDVVREVPQDLKWAPIPGPSKRTTTLRSIGDLYRLIRWRDTGEVVYYKRRVEHPPQNPPDVIDAEPERTKGVVFRRGCTCWYVDVRGWFLVRVVARSQHPARITIQPVTGIDADRRCPWPYGEFVEFPAYPGNPLFRRLRRLAERYT